MTKQHEKKSEMLEVRIPHSKKEAFKAACEAEGITASHAVRSFIDAYLKRSRRMKLKRLTEDFSMTLIQNPIKSAGGFGASIAALTAIFALTVGPTFADRDTPPIEPPRPVYPIDLANDGIGADCTAEFDVSAKGYVETPIEIDCTHPGFVASVKAAVLTLRFEPKIVDGVAVSRTGVVYPISYEVHQPE